MHIGLLIYGSLDTISGGYLYDRKLVEHLQRQGDTVEVISLPWRDYARHLSDNLSTSLYRRLGKARLDVLVQDELNHPSLFWLNRRLKGKIAYPLAAIVHHLRSSELRPAWQNRFYRAVERRYLEGMDGFVFNSQTTRQAVARLSPAQRPQVVAYPAGDRFDPHITAEQIEGRARQAGPLRLLFVGNLIPRKGLHILLEALRQLPASAAGLEVVGSLAADPVYVRSIQDQVQAARLTQRVHFHGALDDAGLAGQFRRCQALVVPSSYEGFGIVYLEGMSFGLPAIATASGAAGEVITDGQDGVLIPAEDPTALAEHLDGLASDRASLAEMSQAARRHYLTHPTWEQSAAQIRSFLQGLARRN